MPPSGREVAFSQENAGRSLRVRKAKQLFYGECYSEIPRAPPCACPLRQAPPSSRRRAQNTPAI